MRVSCHSLSKITATYFSPDLPDGEKKGANDPEISVLIKTQWAAMSAEEKEACTEERRKKMEEDRATKATGQHTHPTNAFHDTSKTLSNVEREVRSSASQTGGNTHTYLSIAYGPP